jgi:uncharacterized membrane protein (UPF0127 family)
MRRIAGFVATVLFVSAGAAHADCDPAHIELRTAQGQPVYTVEIADTPRTQARGLMFRRTLDADAGMLFIYQTPRRAVFWMKNTLIPLDMVFINAQGRVEYVARNARPLDESRIDGGDGIKMILEINGGLAEPAGITAGSIVRHPALAQETALWPCSAP